MGRRCTVELGRACEVDQGAKGGFDGTCEVESGLFVKLDSMALCCLLSAKMRKPKVSDIHAASTFCLRNGLPMSSECFAREFVPERAAEGRTRPTLRRRAASSSACRGGQRGGSWQAVM